MTYAEAVQQHIPMVEVLQKLDTTLAFNLLMGMSGCGIEYGHGCDQVYVLGNGGHVACA